jgi:prophage regulatory protein
MSTTACRYSSDRQLAEQYAVSRATIWRWASEGRIPQPVKLSPGCTRWNMAAVQDMLERAQ